MQKTGTDRATQEADGRDAKTKKNTRRLVMASIKKESSGRRDVFIIAPDKIHEKLGWNIREQTPRLKEHIESLAISIAEIGVTEPITVYMENDVIYLSNGHCRMAAVRLCLERGIEIKGVPCMVEDRYSNEADRVFSMFVRNSSLPTTPMEKAKLLKQMIGFGWSREEIAAKGGITIAYVGRLLELNTLPAEMKELVNDGKVSAHVALDEFKKDSGGAAEKIAGEVAKGCKRVTASKLSGIDGHGKLIDRIERAAALYGEETERSIICACENLRTIMTKENAK